MFAQSIPLDEAADAFATASRISHLEAGTTWGIEVCGPIVFVDASTRDAVANRAGLSLSRSGDLWQGKLPDAIPVSNTAVEWGCL